MQLKRRQEGFTLVEIAVVLVIIGLLLGGVLKGQELISSARVRNMADQQAGIQAAYFGFIDRYPAVPGDMLEEDADNAIQANVTSGGPDDTGANGVVDPNWTEVNAVWEHLSKAGFIQGSYESPGNAESTSDSSPTNVFNGILILARHAGYDDSTNDDPPPRPVLHMGKFVPADIARELDVKVDDGEPDTGTLRNAADDDSPFQALTRSHDQCTTTDDDDNANAIWNIDVNPGDCVPAYLLQ